MDNMFQTLKHAENSDIATTLSDAFKEIWKGHPNPDIRFQFDTGVNYLLNGKNSRALKKFGEVVDEEALLSISDCKEANHEGRP